MSSTDYKDYYTSSLNRYIKNFDDEYNTSTSSISNSPSIKSNTFKYYKNKDDYDSTSSTNTNYSLENTLNYSLENNYYKDKNFLNINYQSSWFTTENNVSIQDYIKQLFIISKNYFSPNVEIDTIKGIIVPHAGLIYSGLCSATGYFAIRNRSNHIRRIILLCTNHQDNQIYTTNCKYFNSFLKNKSNIEIDIKITKELSRYINVNNNIFEQEHSFFMQLPFIESITTHCKLIPLIIGNIELTEQNKININKVINILTKLLKDKDTVIICNSDLSHINGNFNTKIKENIYHQIRESDSKILNFIYEQFTDCKNNRTKKIDDILFMNNTPSCGIFSMFIFSKILCTYDNSNYSKKIKINTDSESSSSNSSNRSRTEKKYKLYPRLVCYYTSLQRYEIDIYNFNPYQCVKTIDIINSNESCVSYGSLIFTTQPYILKQSRHIDSLMTQFEKLVLLSLAREHLYYKLTNYQIPSYLVMPISSPVFKLPLGVFCTITKGDNELRGCIGTTETSNPEHTIETNVKKYIEESAFKDSRFNSLEPYEYNRIQISITILYKIKKININDYFKNKFILGKDGILINYNNLTGYFLPSVATEYNYNKKTLLEQLCINKLGLLSKQCYLDSQVKLYSNQGYEFNEQELL